jgi:hypothetical protein
MTSRLLFVAALSGIAALGCARATFHDIDGGAGTGGGAAGAGGRGGSAGSGVAGQSQGLVLEENVRQFRIDYLNPQIEDDTWEESWDARERRSLPRAVRFTYLDDQGTKISRTYPIMMMVLKP